MSGSKPAIGVTAPASPWKPSPAISSTTRCTTSTTSPVFASAHHPIPSEGARGLNLMTHTTTAPNRALWEAQARGEHTPTWDSLSAEPDGIEQEKVDVPA